MHGMVHDDSFLLAIFIPTRSLCESVSCRTPGSERTSAIAAYMTQTKAVQINCLGNAKSIFINYSCNTSQQDFGTRKVYCVSNVTFHAESKYAIKLFPSPTVFVQWPF